MTMNLSSISAAILFALFSLDIASGHKLYVDAGASQNRDTQDGSPSFPFNSINTAAKKAKAGDEIIVRAGIYREAVQLPAGKSDAIIKLRAENGHHPVISGSEIVSSRWTSNKSAAYIYSTKLKYKTQMVFCDGKPLKQIGSFAHLTPPGWNTPTALNNGGLSDMIPGTFFFDSKNDMLYVWLEGNQNPSQKFIEASARTLGVKLENNTELQGFEVRHTQATHSCHAAILGACVTNVTVKECIVTDNDFAGIILQGENSCLLDSKMIRNGCCGFTSSFGSNLILRGNQTRENNIRGYDMSWHGGGMKITQQRNLKILNHYAEAEKMGVWLDVNVTDFLIAEADIKNCEVGIYYEVSRWGVIVNNTIQNCMRGIWSYSSDVLIANNYLNNCRQGIVVTGEERLAEYCLGYKRDGYNSVATLASVRNNFIINNIIVDSEDFFISIWPDTDDCCGNFSDFNKFILADEKYSDRNLSSFFRDFWGRSVSILDWQARGYDSHSWFPEENQMVNQINHNSQDLGGCTVPLHLAADRPKNGRPWARTESTREGLPSISWGERFFFRRQPEPKKRDLLNKHRIHSGPLGLNPLWKRAGSYPSFE